MSTAIINGRFVLTERIVGCGALIIEDDVIVELAEDGLPAGFSGTVIDAAGLYVAPGFVDIHTHGAGGSDYMDGTAEAIVTAANMHMRHGATSILPTTLTSTNEELFDLLDVFRDARNCLKEGPDLLGLHLEGPYFSREQCGAQDPRYIRDPEEEEYREILRRADGLIRRWSIAPELPGALRMGRVLSANGVVCAAGHTSATYEQMLAAADNGFTHITHLYSGMSTITRHQGFRTAGAVEAGYLIDAFTVEIIADGCHLPQSLLRLITKCKSKSDICLVTDSMRASGMPEGRYLLGSLKNGTNTIVEDGVAKMPDRQAFAGSVCTPDRLVRTMLQKTDLTVSEAVRMLTEVPSRIMGISAKKGSLLPGRDADVVFFDETVQIAFVMSGGKVRVGQQFIREGHKQNEYYEKL